MQALRRFVYKGEPLRVAARPIDAVVAPSHGLLDELQWRVRAFAGKGAL